MATYVIQASVYVDEVNSLEEASDKVDSLMTMEVGLTGNEVQDYAYIRLPDSATEPDAQDSHWELVSDDHAAVDEK